MCTQTEQSYKMLNPYPSHFNFFFSFHVLLTALLSLATFYLNLAGIIDAITTAHVVFSSLVSHSEEETNLPCSMFFKMSLFMCFCSIYYGCFY